MSRKLIKVGSSTAVIIRKTELADLGLKAGDYVDIGKITPAKERLDDFSKELDDFMDKYEQDLKNLAKR